MFYVQNTHKIPPDDFCYVPYRIPFLYYISIFLCFYRVSSAIILFLLTKINQRVVIKYEILPLLFTWLYPARCFGMYMPKSRDIQAKIPFPQAI
jgi:hypothetical protein